MIGAEGSGQPMVYRSVDNLRGLSARPAAAAAAAAVWALGLYGCTMSLRETGSVLYGEDGGVAGGSGGGTDGGLAGSGAPADNDDPGVPGPAVARLTRDQYTRSIQDLVGVTDLPELDLPLDERAGPFVATGMVEMGSLAVSQYVAAAEGIVAANRAKLVQKLPCTAQAVSSDCLTQFVSTFGAKVYRRPLTNEQISDYTSLAKEAVDKKDADTAVSQVMSAMLASPFFLYRLETGDGTDNRALTPFERAARLSYFLTGSTPDDELTKAAANGKLTTADEAAAQVDRLMKTTGFTRQMQRFVAQLLGLDDIAKVTKDAGQFPDFNAKLLAAIAQESGDFVRAVFESDGGRLETLLTAPYSVVTAPLAAFYGLQSGASSQPTKVTFDANQRLGILTQAAFLVTHAHANSTTATVPRGKTLRENLLCQTLPPPPPQTPPLPPVASPNQTAQEMFASHESVPYCAGCHKLMDPLGLAFEHYDSIGKWREKQGSSEIDASGEVTGTANTNVSFADAISLAKRLADSPDVHRCVVRQAWRFAMSRNDIAAPAPLLSSFEASFDSDNHQVARLMATIAKSSAMSTLAPRSSH